jgi:hypothetical protein
MTIEDAIVRFGMDLLRQAVFEFRDLPDGPLKLSRAIKLFGPEAGDVIVALRDFDPYGTFNGRSKNGLDKADP